MMRETIVISLAVLGMGMAGCSNEEEWGMCPLGTDEVYASVEGEGTRTAMQGNSVVWCQDDEISIFVQSDQSEIKNQKYTLNDGIGTGSGKFTSTQEGTDPVKVAALYPYSSTATYNNENKTISLEMKNNYTYSENSNNEAPMACLIEENAQSSLSFKNAGALMCITVKNIPAGYTNAILTSDAKDATNDATVPAIAGKAQITFDEAGLPFLAMASDATGKTITITFDAAETKTEKTFYFPLPVANYPALTVKLTDNNNQEKVLKAKGLNAKRNTRYTTTITIDEVTGEVPTEAENIAAANEALVNNNSVSVKNVASTETNLTISLPNATENKSISFDQISTSEKITIQESENASNAPSEVSVSVPQQEQNQPQMEINLPKSTVTLSANGETATYAKVTATTAENTLILSKGVTVNKLIVKGGNVRVSSGATLTSVERGVADNTSIVTIYKEEGATLPTSIPEGFTVVDAAVAELIKVLKEGGKYTLTKDLTGDFVVSATASVTINLNGFKITNKSGDTFTVNLGSNLTIEGSGTVDNVSHGKACIYNNGTVTLNGGTYTRSKENGQNSEDAGGNSYYCILNHGTMTIGNSVSVEQNGHFSSMIANGYYNYSSTNARNGHVADTNQENPQLTINGGTFSGGLNTVKNDDNAHLIINNGIFNNVSQAVIQNHHIAEISGGTFTPADGAKYVIDNCACGADHDTGVMTIKGGTYTGKIYSHGSNGVTPSLTVTGGTFSDPNVLTSYLGKDANVKVSLNGNYEGPGFGLYEDTNKGQYGMHATIEVDLNNYTWNVLSTPLFGSTGYESQYFHLEKGAKVTFKNGKVQPADLGSGKMLIQNYCILTLSGLTLNGGTACQYVVSNNNGECNIENSTIAAAENMCAFDVYSFNNYTGIQVNVTNSTITGRVEFGGNNGKMNGKLTVIDGTMNGNLVVTEGYYNSETPNIIIDNNVNYGENTGWSNYVKK